jgi:hypothetical protein
MRFLSKFSLLPLLAAAWFTTGLCHAETTPSDSERAAAEALFTQARAQMEKGEYAPACEKLRTSKELDPALGTMLFLGDCYEKANMLASAWMSFEEARMAAEKRGDKRSEIAAVRASALKPRLLYVVVELTGERPTGLEVRANGRVLPDDMLANPAPIDEGPLTVVATAPGYQSSQVELQILPGAKVPYRALLPALRSLREPEPNAVTPVEPPPPDKEAPPPTDDGSGQRTVAYIVGGVGAAGLIAGGVFALLARGNDTDSKKQCDPDDPNACSVGGKALRDDAVKQADIATILGIAGGVTLAAGVTLYVTAPSGPNNEGTAWGLRYGGTF